MTLKTSIIDSASETNAAVTIDNELCTIVAPYPPLAQQKVKPFRQFLTLDGLADGDNDMAVDGSTNDIDFFIPAEVKEDRYITTLSFIVGYGTSGRPFEWADGSELTNGSRLFYSSTQGEVDIHQGIKTNQDVFRFNFALVPANWEVRHVNSNNDFGYFISLDLTKLGLPFGVKLDRGTQQKLTMRIRDNVGADADSFDCIAYGFDRFE